MPDHELQAQADAVTSLIPMVMRRLFAIEDDPAADLPIGQIRLCAVLQDGPRPMSSCSAELGTSLSATCQLADRLEKAGMVERVCESGDRRVKCLQLTPRGQEVMGARRVRRVERAEEALCRLSAADRADIVSALEALLKASAVVSASP